MKPSILTPLSVALTIALAGCATGPQNATPDTPMQPAFKEAPPGWLVAAPADALDRGAWWTLFGDPQLDALAQRVQVSNQNIAAAVAAVDQAQALVREQRTALFPQVGLDAGATRSGGNGSTGNRYQVSVGASWAPDLWGRLRGSTEAAGFRAQATEADLATARLALTGELAASYFSLRATDAARERW